MARQPIQQGLFRMSGGVWLHIAGTRVEGQRDQRGQDQIATGEERDRPEPAAAGDGFAHPA